MAQINITVGLEPTRKAERMEKINIARTSRRVISPRIRVGANPNIVVVKGATVNGVSARNIINKRRQLITEKIIVK